MGGTAPCCANAKTVEGDQKNQSEGQAMVNVTPEKFDSKSLSSPGLANASQGAEHQVKKPPEVNKPPESPRRKDDDFIGDYSCGGGMDFQIQPENHKLVFSIDAKGTAIRAELHEDDSWLRGSMTKDGENFVIRVKHKNDSDVLRLKLGRDELEGTKKPGPDEDLIGEYDAGNGMDFSVKRWKNDLCFLVKEKNNVMRAPLESSDGWFRGAVQLDSGQVAFYVCLQRKDRRTLLVRMGQTPEANGNELNSLKTGGVPLIEQRVEEKEVKPKNKGRSQKAEDDLEDEVEGGEGMERQISPPSFKAYGVVSNFQPDVMDSVQGRQGMNWFQQTDAELGNEQDLFGSLTAKGGQKKKRKDNASEGSRSPRTTPRSDGGKDKKGKSHGHHKDTKKESTAVLKGADGMKAYASNPVVYLQLYIANKDVGRIEIELYKNFAPITAENFRCLCTGEKTSKNSSSPLTFQGVAFHRIIPNAMAQGGDIFGNGKGESIYGATFKDENFNLKHDGVGVVSMANSGKDTNHSQFFICFKPLASLDKKHVVFGQVIKGIELLSQIEEQGTPSGKPKARVEVADCGQCG